MSHGLPRHLFFDLDGTVTDSAPGITRCLAHAAYEVRGISRTPESLRRFIGDPIDEIFAEILDSKDPALIEAAIARYVERFDRVGIRENRLFPGVRELLDRLRGEGCHLYIVSAKTRPVAVRVTELFGLEEVFIEIYGVRPEERHGGKGPLIREALTRHEIAPGDAAMIGDRDHDVRAARTAGVRSIGVTWGYGSAEEFQRVRPDAIAEAPDQLFDVLTSPGGPRAAG